MLPPSSNEDMRQLSTLTSKWFTWFGGKQTLFPTFTKHASYPSCTPCTSPARMIIIAIPPPPKIQHYFAFVSEINKSQPPSIQCNGPMLCALRKLYPISGAYTVTATEIPQHLLQSIQSLFRIGCLRLHYKIIIIKIMIIATSTEGSTNSLLSNAKKTGKREKNAQ